MAHYIIGDIHGCYKTFMALLDHIDFNPSNDRLVSVGDIINRGQGSIDVLRFFQAYDHCVDLVLGNHDVMIPIQYYLFASFRRSVIRHELSMQADFPEIARWYMKKVLLAWVAPSRLAVVVHAGVYPTWSLELLETLNEELKAHINQFDVQKGLDFWTNVLGDHPDTWSDNWRGFERMSIALNVITRMRYLKSNGALDFQIKGEPSNSHSLTPWFQKPRSDQLKIIFGHWSALKGKTDSDQFIALDTGCVWGKTLCAYRLEDEKIFSVQNQEPPRINRE